MVRKPAVAGQFYGGTQVQCAAQIEDCLPQGRIAQELPDPIVAGIVPHAGWIFSGSLAASVFAAVKQVNGAVDTFVIFGAAHRYFDGRAVVYPEGTWQTPLGEIGIDTDVAQWIVEAGGESNPRAHAGEHSIEVQVPFIQYLFPQARIVPVIVPVMGFDQSFGARLGERVRAEAGKKIVFIGSTDLTHYGPRYGFSPVGEGPDALRWAREVNDVEFITMALQMDDARLVQAAMEKGNACGPAAVAVTIAAARSMGAVRGVLLGHTTSSDIMKEQFGRASEESVGYAAIVY